MFSGRANPIRIIGGPDNQRPDKRSSTVYTALTLQVVSDLRALFAVWHSGHASNVTRRLSSVGPTALCDSPYCRKTCFTLSDSCK